jgi:two-component system CheB/CheR fusion protein
MSLQEPPDLQFDALLDYLRLSRGFDFTGYKRSTLQRRVLKRRQALSLTNYAEYLDYLQVHPDEFDLLFDAILINVTSFFRDKPTWDYLSSVILPRIMPNQDAIEPIRVWSAGCASGEEAYTLAMVFAEYLGTEAFHQRVKIYATDLDSGALAQARQAAYTFDCVKDVPLELRSKYFTHVNHDEYVFNSDLRRAVIFGLHDLVQDAPISRLDLLVCRNTLMYFNAETQDRILARFHFALKESAILFLGKAEMLLSHADLFSPVEMNYRYFTKVSRQDIRNRLLALGQTSNDQISTRLDRSLRMRDLAFATSPEAELLVDINGVLLGLNERAQKLFNLAPKDVGALIQEMEICYQPVGLRLLIDQALAENQSQMVPVVELKAAEGSSNYFEVIVLPLSDDGNHVIGIHIIYNDITRSRNLEEKLIISSTELETTNEELQSTIEELETTNEELQSTVEELETTNEELQSTNEELETMNEELQSTNQELETINDELNLRTTELNISKGFLETVLSNLKVGVVVVDREFQILNWNNHAEDLWGLRSSEVLGASLLGLDIGLSVEKLKQPIRSVLDGKFNIQELVLPATNRRGKSFVCRVTCTAFTAGTRERQGVVLMMEEIQDEKPQ